MEARSSQAFPCKCGAAGADLGDLETHVLFDHTASPGVHEPVRAGHRTQRIVEHLAAEHAKAETRQALADAAGVTVDELRSALRGW